MSNKIRSTTHRNRHNYMEDAKYVREIGRGKVYETEWMEINMK